MGVIVGLDVVDNMDVAEGVETVARVVKTDLEAVEVTSVFGTNVELRRAIEIDELELLDVLEIKAELLSAELDKLVRNREIELVDVFGETGIFPFEPEAEFDAGGADTMNV